MHPIDEDVTRLRNFIDALEGSGKDRLPPEPKLAEKLCVSRSRLRTMLKRLEADGTIWRHVGKGTFIGQRLAVSGGELSDAVSVGDIFEARILIEPQLAAQAAIHVTAADIATLEGCVTEMAAANSFQQWKRLDDRLHRAIAEASRNALLLMLYDLLRAQARLSVDARVQAVFGEPPYPREATNTEHASLVAAIKAHDPERAARAMRDHIASVRSSLFGQL